jgi:hypothetical protein
VTIRRGDRWGEPGPLVVDAPVFTDDRSAGRWLASSPAGEPPPELGLLGGDLHRTVGSPRRTEADLRAGDGVRLTVDLVDLRWWDPSGEPHDDVAVAHVVLRGRSWWRGRTVVAMNAAFVGEWNLGPRAHPNDGRLDVTDGALGWQDRRAAARRAPAGAHVPHPALAESRVRAVAVDLDRPLDLWVDGERVGRAVRMTLACRPDAAVVVV